MPKKNQVNRREFVSRSLGVAGAAAVVLPRLQAAPPARTNTANGTVSYGFIGAGSRGQQLLQHLSKTDAGRCLAMCDIYPPNIDKGLKTLGQNADKVADYRQVLDRKDIDAVYIAVPLFAHFEITKAALDAGKHVFCEKSLVFTPEEVHGLRAACAAHPKQVLQTGLQRRYSQFYQMARQMIDKGMLGRVTHIHAQWHRNSDWRRPVKDKKLEEQINWRLYRKYSGGLAAELASHQIDIADWMFGSTPVSVVGVGGIDYWKDGRDVYDNIQLIYTYPKGHKLLYSSINNNAHMPFGGLPGVREVGEVIMGDAGSIQISLDRGTGHGMWYREANAPKQTAAGTAKENWTAGATVLDLAVGKGLPLLPSAEIDVTDKDSFLTKEMKFAKKWLYQKGVLVPEEIHDPVYVELEDFLLCVRDGKKPLADLEVGLHDSIGVILSNLAMDEKRTVFYSEMEKMGRGSAPVRAKA